MWLHAIYFVIGLVGLVAGAEWLVRGSASIAAALGVRPLVIGLTIVALGTSTPEMAVSVLAALQERGDVAIGNVVGSNIANALAVVGASSALRPLPASDLGWTAIGGMLLLSVLAVPVMWRGFRVTRPEGGLLIGAYFVFLALNVRAQ